jgi:hypothetical protein
MKHKSIVIVIVLVLCALAASIAVAQSGPLPADPTASQGSGNYLTFQGRLMKPDGSPVNISVQARFRLYENADPAIAPTAVWTSSLRTVTPINGLFTVYLGTGDDPDLTSWWMHFAAVGVQILPDPEMTPRQPLNTVIGHSNNNGAGIYGSSSGGEYTYGVYGTSIFGNALGGWTRNGAGVKAYSYVGAGVWASSAYSTAGYFAGNAPCCDTAGVRVENYDGAVGLWASTTGFNAGVYGEGKSSGVVGEATENNGVGVQGRMGPGVSGGYAGQFLGNVQITGNLSKGGGSFKIDHPLDPANKYLYHSFVESPDMMNIYNGNATTDANGEAVIQLPAWFEALNQDFRYQLTPIGQFAQAIIYKEIAKNQFTIKTDKPNVKVSWQVTGIRHDPYANAHRIPVEENKPANERGKYLYPELYGQPATMGIPYQQMQRAVQASQSITVTEK